MNEQFLSQDEVDALLDSVDGQASAAESPAPAPAGVVPYDLAHQERIVRGRMPTLEIINERFARNLRLGLFNFMRRNPEISASPVKVQKYSAFLSSLVVPTNLNVMKIRPLTGSALLVIEPQLVFAVIDTLFGGSGRLHMRVEGRDFSATEQRIINRVVDVVCKEYRDAWAGVHPVELNYVRSETQTQFANIATPSEIVVSASFAIDVGETSGSIHLCIPYATLEPIREILFFAVSADQSSASKSWLASLSSQLQSAEIELVADLGSATISFGELLGLRAGDFVELDIPERLVARVKATPVAECRYGVANERYALQVEKFLTDPANLEGSTA